MANSPVKFIKITRDKLVSLPIKEGQLIFVTDTSKLYLDETDNSRIQIDGKDFSYGLTISGNTIGIQKDGGSSSINIPESIPATQKGANNGVAELDNDGKVPSSQLPSYVDDVLEYTSLSQFPATGETGKIYVALDTNKTYRWSGSTYINIASDLALGETSATAYRGDRGKIAYDHSQSTHAPIDAQENIIEIVKVNGESLRPDREKAVDITIPAAAESVHMVNTNSSSVPFVLSNIDPGIYVFPDQQIYLKAKESNTASYSFKSIDRSIVVTGMVTTSLRSNSILCIGTNTNGIGICLAYDNTSGDIGSGLTAIACTSSIVNTGNSQTISGKKTFSTLPESSVVPTTDAQLVNKKYVDDNAYVLPAAAQTTLGGVKMYVDENNILQITTN